ncbi:hypothetical protein GEV33_004553 [Tenebrio molitor]|uniref:Uncharacterized protein n=1 Tax=Tenebrio molitor TaxID=7067 RepID=A0A8J6HRB2_TENMO|nr:hypothetical protein GEV33_004553 [Tenebrio molitor]
MWRRDADSISSVAKVSSKNSDASPFNFVFSAKTENEYFEYGIKSFIIVEVSVTLRVRSADGVVGCCLHARTHRDGNVHGFPPKNLRIEEVEAINRGNQRQREEVHGCSQDRSVVSAWGGEVPEGRWRGFLQVPPSEIAKWIEHFTTEGLRTERLADQDLVRSCQSRSSLDSSEGVGSTHRPSLEQCGALRNQSTDITDTGHGASLDAFEDRPQLVRDSKEGSVQCTTDHGQEVRGVTRSRNENFQRRLGGSQISAAPNGTTNEIGNPVSWMIADSDHLTLKNRLLATCGTAARSAVATESSKNSSSANDTFFAIPRVEQLRGTKCPNLILRCNKPSRCCTDSASK